MDVLDKKRVLALTIGFQAAGLLAFSYAPNLGALVVFLITFGTGYGGANVIRTAIQREYFGRSAFGTIQGMIVAGATVGGIIGPAFTGWIVDTRATYQLAWLVFAIANALTIPMILAMKSPHEGG